MIPPVAVIILLIAIRSYGIWYDLPVKQWVQFLYLFCLGSIVTSSFYFVFIEGNVHLSKSDEHDMHNYVAVCSSCNGEGYLVGFDGSDMGECPICKTD